MAVSLAVTFVLQKMDANSTRRIWGALDSFRSQFERVSDRNFVNVTPLQFSEEILWVHSARLDEALVTAALYLDACDLKSACICHPKMAKSASVKFTRASSS